MKAQYLARARIVFPGERICPGSLLIENGKITALNPREVPASAEKLDCRNQLLTPGLIDLHTHGIHSHAYHYTSAAEEFASALQVLPRYGTTCIFPTIVPPAKPELLAPLKAIAAAMPESGAARMAGYHLEGPFVALGGAACPTLAGDLVLLDEILDACGRTVSIMSVSPEQKNILPVIRRLCRERILPFITHTQAGVEETDAAMDAGAIHATHFYDVFPVPEETEPGVRPVGAVEAILANPCASVDFIADGVHVHPTAIRAAVAAKGWRNVMLITDSNLGAGSPAGVYDTPWGYSIRVRDGDAARHSTRNFLAGSALTMNVGMKNLLRWLPLPPEQIWAMGTLNPALLTGSATKGRIAVGVDADLVLWDEDLNVVKTWVEGQCCYSAAEEPARFAERTAVVGA